MVHVERVSVHVITKPHACLRRTRLSISPLFFFVIGYAILKDFWHTCLARNRPFPSSPGPLFQNEGWCSAFDKEIIFHSHANKTHFHKKGCAPSLILKVRVFGTRNWPIHRSKILPVTS